MKAHELLATPERWTQHFSARTATGLRTGVRDELACCWCMAGAVARCYESAGSYREAVDLIEKRTGERITRWNDWPWRTFEEVRAMLLELDI